MATTRLPLDDFLRPLHVDIPKVHSLARSFCRTFTRLAAESHDQFLSTPISDSILRPSGEEKGRYLAIDIGGTNLRVGFIQLLGPAKAHSGQQNGDGAGVSGKRSRVLRQLEKSWPIGEQLKNNQPVDLFAWIGRRIAEVVKDGCSAWPGELPESIPLGVTFSFPMTQHTLSDATLMSMGKGFTITRNTDLGKVLLEGYEKSRHPGLPRIKISAIANDSVATLVSFAYQFSNDPHSKAAMGLICGTGCNATIPLALSKLHPSKRPTRVKVLDDSETNDDLKITVNTEWTIKGAAGPLHDLNFITKWDQKLDSEGEAPGFQPFEYMTAGRYLGELGRITIVDYFTNHLSIPFSSLPPKLQQRLGLSTTFLGNLGPHLEATEGPMLQQLEKGLPLATGQKSWSWNEEAAQIVYQIANAIQRRAAGLTAAAVIGLLACADEIHFSPSPSSTNHLSNGATKTSNPNSEIDELMVGYTGGCIVHFQSYLSDCQAFLDAIMEAEFASQSRPRVVLTPCHDGGIIGAGILAGTVESIAHDT
ncbi:putative hexokinase family protein XprF [Stipitochalara longipes BDJ]|nr:putative hexokinase family protein XprF [Stipitochalara longipes BDJ]